MVLALGFPEEPSHAAQATLGLNKHQEASLWLECSLFGVSSNGEQMDKRTMFDLGLGFFEARCPQVGFLRPA